MREFYFYPSPIPTFWDCLAVMVISIIIVFILVVQIKKGEEK